MLVANPEQWPSRMSEVGRTQPVNCILSRGNKKGAGRADPSYHQLKPCQPRLRAMAQRPDTVIAAKAIFSASHRMNGLIAPL